tara:strand:- start:1681 stop:2469 length:789 start_codon:yes stop_codon:yes gene_type:complete
MNKLNEIDLFLNKYWNSSKINQGDSILLHANASRLVKNCLKIDKNFHTNSILKTLLAKIGPTGTIIVPTFSFKSINNKFFDIKKTPSEMGIISELVRRSPLSVRTGHPVYSFAVIGSNKKLFENLDNEDAFSIYSPFKIIHNINCKIAIMDLPDSKSMTFYHYIEQMNSVKYRFIKKFLFKYKGINNEIFDKEYSIFVRDLDKKVITDVDRAGDLLWKKNIYKGDKPKFKTGIRVAETKEIFDTISKIIQNNDAIKYLYSYK